MTGRPPGPLLAFGTAVCVVAFAVDHPVVLAVLALGAFVVLRAAPVRHPVYVIAGLVIGLGITLMNPLVQANGDLILFELPDIPIVDLQVTLEELVAGAAMGLRAFAVTVLIGAVLAHVDPDRLLTLAGRLAPRSALTASIAARLLPTLERDATALVETMKLRGRSLRTGSARSRIRTAGRLAVPLVGSALDRSLDVAAAMAARGYGSGPPTRLPEGPVRPSDRVVAVTAIPVLALGVLAIAGRLGTYRFSPTLDPITAGWGLPTAAVCAAAFALVVGALRR